MKPIPTDVLVLWSPGVRRNLAHQLILDSGLPMLGLPNSGARVTNHCPVCGSSEHGPPGVAGIPKSIPLSISISYADDLTIVALTRVGPVGVDVERSEAASFSGVNAVFHHERESMTDIGDETITWVRKESLTKATGRGLIVDPREVQLSPADSPPRLIAWDAPDPPKEPVWLDDFETTGEHVSAVCTLAEQRPQLVVRRVVPADPPD